MWSSNHHCDYQVVKWSLLSTVVKRSSSGHVVKTRGIIVICDQVVINVIIEWSFGQVVVTVICDVNYIVINDICNTSGCYCYGSRRIDKVITKR